MTVYDIWKSIRENSILMHANEETVMRCLPERVLSVRDMMPGEELCSPARKEEHVVVLLEGRAVISPADGGRQVRLRNVGQNALFGIATLFSADNAFPTRIYAATRCRVLFIEAEAFRTLIREDHAANEAFLRFLCDRVVYLNKKIEGFTAGSAERRLALYLAENEIGGRFTVDGSYSALAQTLDIGRASLYRALDTLEKDGMLEKKEHTLYLKNKTAMLEKYSCG